MIVNLSRGLSSVMNWSLWLHLGNVWRFRPREGRDRHPSVSVISLENIGLFMIAETIVFLEGKDIYCHTQYANDH